MKINIIHVAFDGDPDEVVFSYLDERSDKPCPADTNNVRAHLLKEPSGVIELAAERAYRMFNAPLELLDDEDALIAIAYRTQKLRSLCVGDIVEITHPHHRNPFRMVCEPSGWKLDYGSPVTA